MLSLQGDIPDSNETTELLIDNNEGFETYFLTHQLTVMIFPKTESPLSEHFFCQLLTNSEISVIV